MKSPLAIPCYITCLLIFNVARCEAQVTIFDAGLDTEFVDIGIDPGSKDLVLVGNQEISGSDVASVYYLSADGTSFNRSTLTGLGPNTRVNGISPDGVRIAGVSDSPAAGDLGEGTTWLSSAPDNPIGTGHSYAHPIAAFGTFEGTLGIAAWSGGVAGTIGKFDVGFGLQAFRWEPGSFIFADGPYSEFAANVSEASSDGSMFVGNTGDFGLEKGILWNAAGNQVSTFENSVFATLSPNGNWIGGRLGAVDTYAQYWKKEDTGYVSEFVMKQNDVGDLESIFGLVSGVSDSGYMIGSDVDADGFIWHESFNGIDSNFVGAQDFDDWLLAIGGITLPSSSYELVGIAEDGGFIHVAVNSGDQAFVVSINTVPEPSSMAFLVLVSAGIMLRRRKLGTGSGLSKLN